MGRAVDTVAGGNLATLASKLSSLSPELQSRLGEEASSDICWLKTNLPSIHDVFLDLSIEEQQKQSDIIDMQHLKNKVRDLSYDIEDALDEFRVTLEDNALLRRREITEHNFIARIIDTIRTSTERIKNLLQQDCAATRVLRAIRSKENSSDGGGGSSLGASRHGTGGTATLDSSSAPHVVPDGLVQFEAQAQDIIGILKADEDPNLKVCPIVGVGVGGLGMMNLAKLVYSEFKGEFDCAAYVSLPRNPDRSEEVLRAILHAFGCGGGDYQQELPRLVQEHVQDKRYLVVLDGMCNTQLWLSLLEQALPNNRLGSRVIFASYCSDSSGHTDHPSIYTVRHFDSSDTKQFFLRRALGQRECPSQIQEALDIIMRVCDGSPLATFAMSGFLATMALDQWRGIAIRLHHAIQEDPAVVVLRSIISLCYSRLPHHLRTCLLYLSMFPENCEISRKNLVSRWIAEGFIGREGNESLTDAGDRCFHDLICWGLIQPVETKYDGQAKTCRVDSTLMDFIISKAVEENFVTLQLGSNHQESGTRIRRLSIQKTRGASFERLGNEDVPHVRSFTAFGPIEEMPDGLWLRPCLRVLDLSYCYKSDEENDDRNYPIANLEGLFQLKYLNPGPISINSMLSEDMRHLQQLETLDLRRSIDQWEDREELPQTINQLGRLVRLLVDPTTVLPHQIRAMTALEELGEIDIRKQSLQFLRELVWCTKLRKLDVHLPDESVMQRREDTEKTKALVVSLCRLAQCNSLRSLSLSIFDADTDPGLISFGPPWKPALQHLQNLSIETGFIDRVPRWMSTLTCLKKLRLGVGAITQGELDVLGGLRGLVDLFIHFQEFTTSHDLVFHDTMFQNLKRFGVRTGPRERMLVFQNGSMPLLQNYSVEVDAWRFGVSVFADHSFGINHLTSIKTAHIIIRYVSGSEDEVQGVKTAIKAAINNIPSRPIVNIDIVSFGLGHARR